MAGLAGAGGGGGPLGGIGSLLAGKGVVAIIAGLALGAAGGGALVATGAVHVGAGSAGGASGGSQLSLVACPDQGPVIGSVSAGEQVLVTGRTADDAWLELYYPAPGITRAWTEAGPLQLQGSLASLPVHACDAPSPSPSGILAEVSPSPAASPSPQVSPAPQLSPSPGLSPSPSPAPSATPNKGPSLASLTASTKTLYYDPSSYCPRGTVESVTFSVSASDANGVGSVALFWAEPGSSYTQSAMSRSGSKWTVTLSSAGNSINTAGTLAYYVQATDTQGATSKLPSSSAYGLTVKACPNTGPTITNVASSSGSSLYWDPLGAGTCQTATNITAAVSDVDGIRSVTLYWLRPGDSSWSTKVMDNATIPGKWYANLDSLGDKISIPTPPTAALKWYIKAVDTKGAASQSATVTTTVRRCDTRASFDWGAFNPSSVTTAIKPGCPLGTTTAFPIYAHDADNGAGDSSQLKVHVGWQAYSSDGPLVKSGSSTATFVAGSFNEFLVKFDLNGWPTDSYSFTFTVTSTDVYGGTTTITIKGALLSANQC